MMQPIRLFIACMTFLGVAGCGKSGPDPRIEACFERGVAYFKEIGSYPTLSSTPDTGRRAEEVARERCNRTTTAF